MKLLTLPEAVIRYNVQLSYLRMLIESGEVCGQTNSDGILVNKESLQNHIAVYPVPCSRKKFNFHLSEEQADALNPDLFQNDDAFTVLALLSACRKTFTANIRRMSLLVKNKKYRDIFYSVSMGESFKKVAYRYGMNPKTIAKIYETTIKQIDRIETDAYIQAQEEKEKRGVMYHNFKGTVRALEQLWGMENPERLLNESEEENGMK